MCTCSQVMAGGAAMPSSAPASPTSASPAPAPAPGSTPAVTGGGITATPELVAALSKVTEALTQLASILPTLTGASLATGAATTTPSGAASAAHAAAHTAATSAPTTGGGAAATATSQAKAGVLLIGDSLTVGVRPHMPKDIDGAPVTIDATGGISLAEGMRRYDAVKEKPRVVEMALFTNNSPKQVGELRAAIEKTVADARQRGGRVVWATIVRPGNYDEVNAMIRDMAAKNADVMGLVDWAQMVKDKPGLVGGDGVHSSPDGYKVRAQAFVDAARA